MWSYGINAVQFFYMELKDVVEIVDLRTLYPFDEATIMASVKKTKKCLIVTEKSIDNSLARVQEEYFKFLDAPPVMTIESENIPDIPLNSVLEKTIIPSTEKVKVKIEELLSY